MHCFSSHYRVHILGIWTKTEDLKEQDLKVSSRSGKYTTIQQDHDENGSFKSLSGRGSFGVDIFSTSYLVHFW